MKVLPLEVPREALSEHLRVGDIVTLGTPENLARDWRTGIPVPPTQKFRIVCKESASVE